MHMSYYFYIARCSDDTLYAGMCKDLSDREAKHNDGTGAKYTRGRGPVKMVYSEELPSLSAALKREIEVKKWSRAKKEKLIS